MEIGTIATLEHIQDLAGPQINNRGDEPAARTTMSRRHHGLIEPDLISHPNPTRSVNTRTAMTDNR